jgi:hypothetical protein
MAQQAANASERSKLLIRRGRSNGWSSLQNIVGEEKLAIVRNHHDLHLVDSFSAYTLPIPS